MTNNIKYSIEKQDGNILVRSTVNSFNLDHVTDKDITSYYRNVSNQALFDTGLLPLNGTGTLAIRSAGRHTQIAFQHAPALAATWVAATKIFLFAKRHAHTGARNVRPALRSAPAGFAMMGFAIA